MNGIVFSGKWLKFLTWPGLACFTAGLVAGSISSWEPLPVGLLVLGLGLLLLGFSFSGKTAGAFWQQRSTQAGTNAVVATLAMVVILGLLNFLAVQHTRRLDLTETQLFTLAPASQEIVQKLDRSVRLVIFDTVQNPQDVQLLESYERAGKNFRYEYIDPFANPTLANQFGANRQGMAFLEVGEERRFLQTIGSATNPQSLEGAAALSERKLSNALDQIMSDRRVTIYFTQGHEEFPIDGSQAGLTEAAAALTEKAFEVRPLNLTETRVVPDDASVVVVAGPAQDFFPAEVNALQTYLDSGGGLLLLLNPRADGGLNRLLDDWEVILDDRIVLDTSGAGQFVGLGPAAPIVSNYGDHPITQEFANGRTFFPLARPIESNNVPGISTTPLLLTNPQSLAEAVSDEGNLNFDPNATPEGPYTLGVALSRPTTTAAAPQADTAEEGSVAAPTTSESEAVNRDLESRLVVIGNAAFATDGVFNQQLNGDLFLNAVSWLSQEADVTLSIRPKTVTDRRLQITGQQAWSLGLFSLLVLPLTGLALALVMALRRR